MSELNEVTTQNMYKIKSICTLKRNPKKKKEYHIRPTEN